MTAADATQLVRDSIAEFLAGEPYLLEHNLSERSLTHKLAMYVQRQIEARHSAEGLHVDCEYNRNAELGDNSEKLLKVVWDKRRARLGRLDAAVISQDTLNEYSTYPDIIVHRRGDNGHNAIVIEVKKDTSVVPDDYDVEKLTSFTHPERGYHYTLGAFVKLRTGGRAGEWDAIWFEDGQRQE